MAIVKVMIKIGVLYPIPETYRDVLSLFSPPYRKHIGNVCVKMRFMPSARGGALLLGSGVYDAWRQV